MVLILAVPFMTLKMIPRPSIVRRVRVVTVMSLIIWPLLLLVPLILMTMKPRFVGVVNGCQTVGYSRKSPFGG